MLNTTWSIKRGIGKFKIVVSNIAGPGGFVGKIVIDGVDYLTNVDNF